MLHGIEMLVLGDTKPEMHQEPLVSAPCSFPGGQRAALKETVISRLIFPLGRGMAAVSGRPAGAQDPRSETGGRAAGWAGKADGRARASEVV